MIVLPQNIQQHFIHFGCKKTSFLDNSPQKIDPKYKELFVPRNGYICQDSWHLPIQKTWSRQAIVTYRNDDVPYRNPIYIYINMGVKQNVSKFLVWGILTLNKTCQTMIPNCQKKRTPRSCEKLRWNVVAYLSKSPTIRMGLEPNGMELARDLAATWEGFKTWLCYNGAPGMMITNRFL